MHWTPKKKNIDCLSGRRKHILLPFRCTSAAKKTSLSLRNTKQAQFPELSYLYPGFEQLYNKYIMQENKLITVLRYIEACILDLEKTDICPDQTLL